MRKPIAFFFILAGVFLFFPSCKKGSDAIVIAAPDETINVKIAPNQSYQMDLANAGNVTISRQAAHFLVSEAVLNNENGSLVYKYTPAPDFNGSDEVVLRSTITSVNYSSGTSGGCQGNDYTTSTRTKSITVKITVSN